MSLSIDELVLLKSWPRQICSVETKRGNPISYVEYRNLCVLEKKIILGETSDKPNVIFFHGFPYTFPYHASKSLHKEVIPANTI